MNRAALLVLAALACGETTSPTPAPSPDAGATASGDSDTAAPEDAANAATGDSPSPDTDVAQPEDASGGDDATDGGDHPDPGVAPLSPKVRRLSVETLRRSLPRVMGNDATGAPITWEVTVAGAQVDALSDEGLAATLGKADYVQVTSEDRTVSPLYVKFMDDMARDVCAKRLAADAVVDAPVLVVTGDDAALRAHLRTLLLRFHGERVAPEDPVEELYAVYATAGGGAEGWGAVCVALLTSPAFHLY